MPHRSTLGTTRTHRRRVKPIVSVRVTVGGGRSAGLVDCAMSHMPHHKTTQDRLTAPRIPCREEM